MKRLVVLAVTAFAAACQSTSPDNLNVLPRDPPDGWGQLRVMHAAPNTLAVDVYASDLADPLLQDLSYGFAQGFIEIAAQAYTIQLRPAGETVDYPMIYSQDMNLPSTERHTLVLAGDGASLQFVEITDELHRVDPGSVRVVNASSSTASLDFVSDGNVELPSLAPFASAPATTPDLQPTSVTVNGTIYSIPARPNIGDVVFVVTDTFVDMLTYSFTVTTLSPK